MTDIGDSWQDTLVTHDSRGQLETGDAGAYSIVCVQPTNGRSIAGQNIGARTHGLWSIALGKAS